MSQVSKEYGEALFLLLEEEHLTDALLGDVLTLRKVFVEQPEYIQLLSAPTLAVDEKKRLLEKAFEGLHEYVLHFLFLMVERGYARELASTLSEVEQLYRKSRHETVAVVESCIPLTEEEKSRLKARLEQKYKQTITLEEHIRPDLLGGLRVTLDGVLMDGTIKHQLETLEASLQGTVL